MKHRKKLFDISLYLYTYQKVFHVLLRRLYALFLRAGGASGGVEDEEQEEGEGGGCPPHLCRSEQNYVKKRSNALIKG